MNTRTMLRCGVALCLALLAPLAPAACLTVEAEPNNSDKAATTGLCSGTGVSGTIASSTDVDWYQLDLTGPGAISVHLAHDSGIDLDWYLYKASGNYVAYRSTASNPETGSYSAGAAGTYYLRVKSYTGSGRYTLGVTFPGATGGGGGGGGATPCILPSAVNLGKTGNPTPKATITSGGVVLMSGGTDVDAAIQWMNARSGGGDLIVLRSTGTNAYNAYIYGLGGVNSVQTLLITSAAQANNACVVQTIKNAGALFMAGGNQADYINYFKGQGVGAALNYLMNTKQAPVGGTSAGMAILGQYYHPGGAEVATALQNPTAIAIGNNFLSSSSLTNLVTEPHFIERLRQPRLAAFLASTLYNYGVTWQSVRGVSADEASALAIDANGAGRAFGSGKVNFVRATGAAETLSPGAPLTWLVGQRALQVYEVPATATGSNTFNMGTWTGTGGVTRYWSINNGKLTIH